MPPLIDPLADLKAEIAAAVPAPDPVLEETAAEEARLAAEEEQTRAAEAAAASEVEAEVPAKPAKKGKKAPPPEERMVPVERMNEYAVRVRQLEKEKEELERKLNPLPEPPPQAPKTEAQIRAEERALARLDVQMEAFSAAGNERYTQKAFDAACDKIAKLINGPTNLISLAIEATGTPKDAANAIMALGQGDAPEIEAFLKLSLIKQATHLAKLAAARTRKAATAEDEPAPRRRAKVEVEEDEDEEIQPLRPLSAGNAVNESLGDDVPMDLWVERFDKQVLNKGKLAH